MISAIPIQIILFYILLCFRAWIINNQACIVKVWSKIIYIFILVFLELFGSEQAFNKNKRLKSPFALFIEKLILLALNWTVDLNAHLYLFYKTDTPFHCSTSSYETKGLMGWFKPSRYIIQVKTVVSYSLGVITPPFTTCLVLNCLEIKLGIFFQIPMPKVF